jgi:hypothetical protein
MAWRLLCDGGAEPHPGVTETKMDETVQAALGKPLAPEIAELTASTDPLFVRGNENWNRIARARKHFGQNPSPVPPLELIQEMAQLTADNPGISHSEMLNKLSPDGKLLHKNFQSKVGALATDSYHLKRLESHAEFSPRHRLGSIRCCHPKPCPTCTLWCRA